MRPLKQLVAANQGNHLSGITMNAMNFLKLHHVSRINQGEKLDQEGEGLTVVYQFSRNLADMGGISSDL